MLIGLGGGAMIVVKHLDEYAKSETSTAFNSVRVQTMDLAQLWKWIEGPGLGLKFLEWAILQKASIGGSERKKWINLVQMASIGKPMKLRPQLDFEAKYQPFGHSMAVFLTSMGAEKWPKMVRIGLK